MLPLRKWSKDDDDVIRELASDGASAKAIANEITNRVGGRVSRHMVIRRCRTIGVKLSPSKAPDKSGLRYPVVQTKGHRPSGLTANSVPLRPIKPQQEEPKPHRNRTVLVDQVPPEACNIFDLKSGKCKWPYTTDKGYLFCNSDIRAPLEPYCTAHWGIAYNRPRYRV